MAMPITENVAPPRSMKWVGDHSVTSCPKIRCQTSSSGSAARPNAEQKIISAPPTGIRQLPPRRTQAGPGSWPWASPRHSTPAANEPKKPNSIGQWPGLPSGPSSRP